MAGTRAPAGCPGPGCTPPGKDLQGKQFPRPIPAAARQVPYKATARAGWGLAGPGRAQYTWLGLAQTLPAPEECGRAQAGLGTLLPRLPPTGPDSAWVGREAAASAGPALPPHPPHLPAHWGLKQGTGPDRGAERRTAPTGLGGTAGMQLNLTLSCTAQGLLSRVPPTSGLGALTQ